MSKASPTDVENMGFNAHQFGDPDNWSGAGGYLQQALDDAALEVRSHIGASVYDAADAAGTDTQKLNEKRIRNAETYLAAAELFRRLEAWERQQVTTGGGDSGAETIGSRLLRTAEEYADRAWNEVALVSGSTLSASVSQQVVETGRYSTA